MKIGVIPPHAELLDDDIFALGDDLLSAKGVDRVGFNNLYKKIQSSEHTITTIDNCEIQAIDVCLFIDIHYGYLRDILQLGSEDRPALAYQMRESPAYASEHSIGYFLRLSEIFDTVFTWDDRIVSLSNNFHKYNYPQRFEQNWDDSKQFTKKTLLCNISGYKYSQHPDELYSARKNVIEFFDEHHPSEFNHYGIGWDEPHTLQKKFYNGINTNDYRTYNGGIKEKKTAYHNHKFALAFENITGIDGYISEKIFDCFKAGVVPVYLGAENIGEYIPEDSYIDYREFRSPEKLYSYISGLDESSYNDYRESGKQFMISKPEVFSPEQFAQTFYDGLTSIEKGEQRYDQRHIERFNLDKKATLERLKSFRPGTHCGVYLSDDWSSVDLLSSSLDILKHDPFLIVRRPEFITNIIRTLVG